MKHQYKQTIVTLKAFLFLCISSVVLGDSSDVSPWKLGCPIVEEIALKTVTVYLDYINGCADTLIIEDINFRVKRNACWTPGQGCGDGGRFMKIPMTDIDNLTFTCGRYFTWWNKGPVTYPAFVDSISLQKFYEAVYSFEISPVSCLHNVEWWLK